jgi:hypothetical protein
MDAQGTVARAFAVLALLLAGACSQGDGGPGGPTDTVDAGDEASDSTPASGPLLEGATPFAGELPETAEVTFTTRDGDTLTIEAFRGLVLLLAAPPPGTPAANVAAAVQVRGGQVVAQVPAVGIYLAAVAPGTEDAFLTGMFAEAWLDDGSPAAPVVPGTIKVGDYFVEDFSSSNPCWYWHGRLVKAVAGRSGAKTDEVDFSSCRRTDCMISLTLAAMYSAAINDERAVINLSVQSGASGSAKGQDRTDCSDAKCRAIRHQQVLFYQGFLKAMEEAIAKDPSVADNTVFVIIAGNAGIDLDAELAALKYRFPNAWKHVKVVGGTDEYGGVDPKLNHLKDGSSGNMVYARARGVQAGDFKCDGTSYAAPEVSRVLDFVWSRNPKLTAAQVTDAFDQAIAEGWYQGVLPQDADGLTSQWFVDRFMEIAKSMGGTGPEAEVADEGEPDASIAEDVYVADEAASEIPPCLETCTPVCPAGCNPNPPSCLSCVSCDSICVDGASGFYCGMACCPLDPYGKGC